MIRALPALLALLGGCAARVQVHVPPAPAVQLQEEARVSVVTADRACRPFATALLERIDELEGIGVDTRSDLRVVVFSCGRFQQFTVEEAVAEGEEQRHRREGVSGRAYAVAAVTDQGRLVAHLLGTSRAGLAADVEHSGPDLPAMGRSVEQKLVDAVATDLALQLSPGAYPVTRRIYPKAPDGSARQLYTAAVQAELSGDLERAYALAVAARRERPTPRNTRYVMALESRLTTRLAVSP